MKRSVERLHSALWPAALALLLGIWGITREGTMWRDESVSYQVSHRSLPEIVKLLDNADAVHGAYYLFMHALFSFWDGGLLALRLPSVLAISTAATFVGLTAFHIAGRRAGVLSGLAFAVTPEVQMYAQEGRSYAMVCALVALSTYIFVRLLEQTSKRRWVVYSTALLAACWLHEFAVLALFAHGSTLFFSETTGRFKRSWAKAAGVVVAGLIPVIILSMGQSGQVAWIGGPKLREWFELAGTTLLAAACAKYLASRTSSSPGLPRLALPLTIVPTAVLLVAAVYEHMYVDRYVLYTNIGLSMLVGTTLHEMLERIHRLRALRNTGVRRIIFTTAAVAFVVAMTPVALQMRTPDSRKDDVTAISKEVQRVSNKGDAVIFTPSRRREWRLSYAEEFKDLSDLAMKASPSDSGTLQGVELTAAEIKTRMVAFKRIVVLSDPPGQPVDAIEQESIKRETLGERFVECERTQVKGAQITLYAQLPYCDY